MKAADAIDAHFSEAEALPPRPPAIVQQARALDQRSLDIVTACLIGEAGGEGATGMQAVMNVIANRAGGDFNRFQGVCLRPMKFSMFNRATGRTPTQTVDQIVAASRRHPCWNQAQVIVRQAVAGTLTDVTGNARYYHNQTVNPRWANPQRRTAQVGAHTFYRESTAEQIVRRLL